MEYLLYLYTLPLNLVFIGIGIWKRHILGEKSVYALMALSLFLVAITIVFPDKYAIKVWLFPSGNVAFLCLALWLFFLHKTDVYFHESELELPNRVDIRQQMSEVQTQEARQRIYLNLIKKTSAFWLSREEKLTKINSKLILTGSFSIFLITLSVLAGIHIFGHKLDVYFFELFVEFNTMLKQTQNPLAPQEQNLISEEHAKNIIQTLFAYGPGVLFISISLLFIFTGSLFKNIDRLARKKDYPVGSLSNFIVSERSVWLFIILLGVQLLNLYSAIDTTIMFIANNLSLALIFLYVLHGYSIVRVYIHVRLLMFGRVTTIVFLVSFLFMSFNLFLGLMLLYALIGLFDFWFYFRKKALQPKFNIE